MAAGRIYCASGCNTHTREVSKFKYSFRPSIVVYLRFGLCFWCFPPSISLCTTQANSSGESLRSAGLLKSWFGMTLLNAGTCCYPYFRGGLLSILLNAPAVRRCSHHSLLFFKHSNTGFHTAFEGTQLCYPNNKQHKTMLQNARKSAHLTRGVPECTSNASYYTKAQSHSPLCRAAGGPAKSGIDTSEIFTVGGVLETTTTLADRKSVV